MNKFINYLFIVTKIEFFYEIYHNLSGNRFKKIMKCLWCDSQLYNSDGTPRMYGTRRDSMFHNACKTCIKNILDIYRFRCNGCNAFITGFRVDSKFMPPKLSFDRNCKKCEFQNSYDISHKIHSTIGKRIQYATIEINEKDREIERLRRDAEQIKRSRQEAEEEIEQLRKKAKQQSDTIADLNNKTNELQSFVYSTTMPSIPPGITSTNSLPYGVTSTKDIFK